MPDTSGGTQPFDQHDALEETRKAIIKRYEKKADQYLSQFVVNPKKKAWQEKKYPNATIISFRSACEAKDRLNIKNTVSYADIAKAHNLPLSTAQVYRTDYTHRSNCMPDEQLIEKFIEQYKAATTEVRVIKALRRGEDPKKIHKPNFRIEKKHTYTKAMKLFKKYTGAFPEDMLEAFLMLRTLHLDKLISVEDSREIAQLILDNLTPIKEIKKIDGRHNPK